MEIIFGVLGVVEGSGSVFIVVTNVGRKLS